MKREDIKTIMIAHHDNDFIRTWDWIGKVVLMTIISDENICGEKVLEDSDGDWIFGGSETLIIDIVNKKSYIR